MTSKKFLFLQCNGHFTNFQGHQCKKNLIFCWTKNLKLMALKNNVFEMVQEQITELIRKVRDNNFNPTY